jgi:hypothetical protein
VGCSGIQHVFARKIGTDSPGPSEESSGLGREYAFRYNYAIDEPMTLLVPNYYGGTSRNLFVQDRDSEVYKALAKMGDEKTFNQLAYYSGAYWGPSTPSPYYAGAVIVFLFVLGILFAEKKICVVAHCDLYSGHDDELGKQFFKLQLFHLRLPAGIQQIQVGHLYGDNDSLFNTIAGIYGC